MNKLAEPVLVLNKGYQAIHVIPARKAVSLLYQDVAEAIGDDFGAYPFSVWCNMGHETTDENYNYLHSPNIAVRIPHVIRLTIYDKLPIKDVMFNRKNIYARDKGRCQYCGKKFRENALTFDHIIPKSKGGSGSWTNIVTACKVCNGKKANRTPIEAKMVLLKKPVKPRWRSYVKIPMSSLKEIKLDLWKEFLKKPFWEIGV